MQMLDQYTKKWILLIKTSILPLLSKVYERVIKRQIILNSFSKKFYVDLKKHKTCSMFYFQIINFMEKFVKIEVDLLILF